MKKLLRFTLTVFVLGVLLGWLSVRRAPRSEANIGGFSGPDIPLFPGGPRTCDCV